MAVFLPEDEKKLIGTALEMIQQCRTSVGKRASFYQGLDQIIETGKQDGTRSKINKLYRHHDRLAAHLFSPSELKFTIDFENHYPANILQRAAIVAKLLTRDFERSNTDIEFGQGVFESLKYGAAILKQWVQQEGEDKLPVYHKSLVMPWQFGVEREDVNELGKQAMMCETIMLSMPEVWRRIWHLPDADKLFARIKANAKKGESGDEYNSFFHNVLSTSQLNTSGASNSPAKPGGIVQLDSGAGTGSMGPEIAVDLVKFHELWVQGQEDYVTIQLVEPDILVAPRFKRVNLLMGGSEKSMLHPYTLIQANRKAGYIWGRPEAMDLIEPQGLLSTWAEDIERLFGLQIDKVLGFSGFDGLTDENYDQRRAAGFFNGPPGSTINDLTPSFPPESLKMLELAMSIIDMLGGFDNILGGQAQPGVRAGVHADTMVKTSSPSLKDRSLLLERQCAAAADLRLSIMEAKDGRAYWTDGTDLKTIEATKFSLADLPEDRRVSVDSHSSSPIFADDHQQIIGFGVKSGFVDGDYAVEHLPFPDKDTLHQSIKKKAEEAKALQQQLLQKDPQALEKLITKGHGGHH